VKKKIIRGTSKMANANQMISEIMAGFDFEMMRRFMSMSNHLWAFPGGVRLPTVPELKEEATRLLTSMAEDLDTTAIECGGFRVYRDADVIVLEYVALWAGAIFE
jgi:hypothetical protein